MQREIKFRVWDKHTKTFIYFGDKFWFDDTANTITFQCSSVLGERDPDGNRFVLLQFTGLRDKNEKEIYEGDIVKIIGALNAEIYWDFGSWQLRNKGRAGGLLFNLNDHLEVIGNIYQDSHLLKDTK